MESEPTLLFVHGQNGDGDKFVSVLNAALTQLGYPELNMGS